MTLFCKFIIDRFFPEWILRLPRRRRQSERRTLTSHVCGRNMMLRVHVVCCLLLPGRLEVQLERRGGGGGRNIGSCDISQHLKGSKQPQKMKMSSWSTPFPAFVTSRKALLTARDLSSTYVFVSSCCFARAALLFVLCSVDVQEGSLHVTVNMFVGRRVKIISLQTLFFVNFLYLLSVSAK